jgi:hypothetical protein
MILHPRRYLRTALALSVALWFGYGLLTAPEVLSVVLTFAALPLLFVVLPALVVWAADSGSVRLELRVRLPTTGTDERREPAPGAVTDGVEG